MKKMIKNNKRIFDLYVKIMTIKYIISIWFCKFSKYYIKSIDKIKKIKNVHNNQRCFIIGNGPSLRIADLEKLKDEVTFATNMIFSIFDETSWRPTYYISQDLKAVEELYQNMYNEDIFDEIGADIIFLPIDVKKIKIKYDKRFTYFYINRKKTYPKPPNFSSNILKKVDEGFTVTYTAMQIAAYMGFKEIILLGVDHNYSKVISPSGDIIHNNCVKDHFSDNYKRNSNGNLPNLYASELAYKSAMNYAIRNNIKILNATRGGKLEIFDKIDFDIIKN